MGDLKPSLGIICGMQSELQALGRWAHDPRVRVAVSGARPQRAELQAQQLVTEGCRVFLSWGMAGGLDPALLPGDLVIPAEVVAEDGRSWMLSPVSYRMVAADLPSRLSGEGQGGSGRILGLDRVVLSTAEKALIFERTGVAAVDMETHVVARVAADAGLAAVAVRAICDPAGQVLPDLVARALGEDGRPRIRPVIAGLLRRPSDLPALLRVKRDADAALATLASVADKAVMAALSGMESKP